MSIIYRNIKGMPLTSEEVDNNFKELDERLHALEGQHDSVETINGIEQDFNTIKFITNRGREIGNVTIPFMQLNPRGLWKTGNKYLKNDIVANGSGSIWVCLTAHTSANWEGDASNWSLFLQFNGV